jgi:hypothetical protein
MAAVGAAAPMSVGWLHTAGATMGNVGAEQNLRIVTCTNTRLQRHCLRGERIRIELRCSASSSVALCRFRPAVRHVRSARQCRYRGASNRYPLHVAGTAGRDEDGCVEVDMAGLPLQDQVGAFTLTHTTSQLLLGCSQTWSSACPHGYSQSLPWPPSVDPRGALRGAATSASQFLESSVVQHRHLLPCLYSSCFRGHLPYCAAPCCVVRVGRVLQRLSSCPSSSAASLHLPPSLSLSLLLLLYQATAACPNCNCTLLALRPDHISATRHARLSSRPTRLNYSASPPPLPFPAFKCLLLPNPHTFDSECALDRHQLPSQLSNTAESTPCPFSSERKASHRQARSRLRPGRYHRRMVRDPHHQPSMGEAVARSRRIVWGLRLRRRRLVRA